MAILAGIDEAGYGPILGPLVVSAVSFRVPDADLGKSLWETLGETVAKSPRRGGRRLIIADSKRLYHSRGSLAPLERAALVMLAVAGHRPKTWRELLAYLAPDVVSQLGKYPWYAEADPDLPLSDEIKDIGIQTNAIRRDCATHRVEPLGALSEVLPAGQFNRLVQKTRNKAVVLLGLAMRVADRIQRGAGDARVRLYVDRLGGRQHYREPLLTTMPGCDLHILEESPERSAYRLTKASRIYEIEFATGGEERHFPVALASVYSKYVRELFMHVFNGYWSKRAPGLRPTAGYYTDARRWLREVAPTLAQEALPPNMLIRER